MKFTKFAAVSALTLALAGTGMAPAMADEKEAVQQETINTNIQENAEISNHEEYFGSDSWKWVRSLLASYSNQPLVGGEFKNSFQVGTSNYDIRYNIANRGSSTLNWKIYTPAGNIWNSGTLKPGESKTYTAWADFDFIPVGEYKISIISSNGGAGAFDFAVRSLN
ncbi:hypothetical protein [Lysinibacillus fusiformis]|uniref:hypothetical protein n=1 Tax=Lysinibacillus fusiformis TaxID=28031 RepID=UPI002E225B73|nr:hypothetical protein [Lysinibacillus fusiformis]